VTAASQQELWEQAHTQPSFGAAAIGSMSYRQDGFVDDDRVASAGKEAGACQVR
jgi:hypothetical protein